MKECNGLNEAAFHFPARNSIWNPPRASVVSLSLSAWPGQIPGCSRKHRREAVCGFRGRHEFSAPAETAAFPASREIGHFAVHERRRQPRRHLRLQADARKPTYHGSRTANQVRQGFPGPLMKSPLRFKQYGQSGKWVSDLFPNIGGIVDELAFIHSARATVEHTSIHYEWNTGISSRWVTPASVPGSLTVWAARTRTSRPSL